MCPREVYKGDRRSPNQVLKDNGAEGRGSFSNGGTWAATHHAIQREQSATVTFDARRVEVWVNGEKVDQPSPLTLKPRGKETGVPNEVELRAAGQNPGQKTSVRVHIYS